MLKLRSIRNNKLLVRFILSYVFILIVPLLMGLQGYQKATDIVKKEIRNSNLSVLEQAMKILDGQLKELETMSTEIATNPRVNALVNLKLPLDTSAYYDFSATIREMPRYTLNRKYINDFYIYLKSTDYVLTPETLYPADVYFSSVLKDNMNDYSKWQDTLMKNYYTGKYMPNGLVPSDTSVASNITYIQSLPLTYLQQSKGALVVSYKKDSITELIPKNVLSSGGWAYILDRDNNTIINVSNDKNAEPIKVEDLKDDEGFIQKNIGGKNMIITYTTSKYNGWKYIIALPSDYVFQQLNTYKRINWAIFFTTLFIGIAIACILAYHNSKPLFSIVKQLKEFIGEDNSKNEDTFSIINGSISQLITTNKALHDDITTQKPLIEVAFIDKLLKGQVYNETELMAMSSYVGINLGGKKYIVLLIRLYNNDSDDINLNRERIQELNISKALLRGIIAKYMETSNFLHDVDYRTTAVLINSDLEDNDVLLTEIEKITDNIKSELFDTYNLNVFISGGEVSDSPLDIWHSFEQAEQALNYTSNNSSSIVWYSEIPKEGETYYYPLDFEQRLINYVKVGDISQVQKLIQIIYDENFNTRSLSIHMTKQLISEIKSTIIKVMAQFADESTIKKLVKGIDSANSVEENFKLVEDIYTKICDLVVAQKNNQNMDLMDSIKTYIDLNYMDQELCLYKVSSNFNLSEGYFSHLFKDQTGINFTDYLEKVRMDRARELLKDKDLNINEISEMVGYNSAQSFRRAFKRLCGVSPTALRDS